MQEQEEEEEEDEVEVVPRKYVTPKEIAVRMMKWCVCGFEKMKERRY